MTVEDSGLHLIPSKSYLGASSDMAKLLAQVWTHVVVVVRRSSVHTALTNVSL